MLNNIYGVDIDPQAVEVTKLSLLLKVLDGETEETISSLLRYARERALPDLGSNIKCGNSLIGWDILDDRPDLSKEELARINPFDWQAEFPEVFGRGGFDAVIGNPPYVRQEILGKLKGYFQTHYKSYHGIADLYVYFIERGLSFLKNNGIFSYIVASKWMRTNYGGPLRKLIRRYRIEEIIDFGDLGVFPKATTYPSILRVSRMAPNSHFNAVLVKRLDFFNLSDYVNDNCHQVSQFDLEGRSWSLADDRSQSILSKLNQNSRPLKEFVNNNIHYGIKTGLNKAFVIDGETKKRISVDDPKSANLLMPFLAGKDIKRYQPLLSDNYLIFIPKGWTNENLNNDVEPADWLRQNYPAITEHLLHYADLAEKRYDKGDFWWELRTCDYYDEFKKSKILWPGISKEISAFAFDNQGYLGNDNNQFIVTKDLYLLGIINSRLIRLFLTNLCDKVQGGFYRLKMIYIQQIPIHTIDFSNPKDVARHDRMVSLVQTMLDLHKQLAEVRGEHERTLLQRQIEATDRQIDALVYELYGLTEEEIRIVEEARK